MFSEKNDFYVATTRFDHIHIYVAQNRRGVGIEAVKVRNGHKLVKEGDEMKSPAPFPFLDLSETQKTAVYHRIDFWQKFKLRLVARVFHQRPAHHLIIGTRFNDIYVETQRPEWIYRRLDPYNEIMFTIDDGIGHTHLDVTVDVGHFGPPLELVFLNMQGGGPIRDALDVLRWPFVTGCMAETAEDFKTVLHAERQLARQPYRFSLQFGDHRTAWRAPLTDDEYGLIFAEPKYQLPDKLRNLLKAQIGPNDEATAFRHTQFSEKNDSHEATRFDQIHIYVAQNRRGVGIEAVKVRNGYKLVKERDECVPIPWR
ncbi:unnamed protein product, partial [Mesorhabditis spiculigera]